MEKHEFKEMVRYITATLTDFERDIFILRVCYDASFADIAKHLGRKKYTRSYIHMEWKKMIERKVAKRYAAYNSGFSQ